MRQSKILALGILAVMCAMSALFSSQVVIACAFAAPAALCLGLWFYRYQRDKNIIAQARQDRQQAVQTRSITPPMESKGSRRLFVPPPLD